MDKNSVDWRGHWVALVTPFDADGNVDEAAFRLNVEQCISTVGVTGLVPCGCTGEFWAQTNEERKRVIKACVETAAGRVPVVAGTGAIRTADVIELSDYAGQAGCDGVMIVRIIQNDQGFLVPPDLVAVGPQPAKAEAGELVTLIDMEHYMDGSFDPDVGWLVEKAYKLHDHLVETFHEHVVTDQAIEVWQ